VATAQQLPPLMAFSVQFATEFTSDAAPRTVLHAASAKQHPIVSAVTSFETIDRPPYVSGTINGRWAWLCLAAAPQQLPVPSIAFSVQLATELTSAAAPRTVLQAARIRAVPTRAAVAIF
jgi:hypothetical protein